MINVVIAVLLENFLTRTSFDDDVEFDDELMSECTNSEERLSGENNTGSDRDPLSNRMSSRMSLQTDMTQNVIVLRYI